jgi:hypothetical protein
LLKKPTADIQSFTDENWTETGSYYFSVGFGKNGTQWKRSWGSAAVIPISDGITISASSWARHD